MNKNNVNYSILENPQHSCTFSVLSFSNCYRDSGAALCCTSMAMLIPFFEKSLFLFSFLQQYGVHLTI